LGLGPDLEQVNGFGGDLIDSIIHGSESRQDIESSAHAQCAQLALEAGARLSYAVVKRALNEEVATVLADWARGQPGGVVGNAQDKCR